MFRINSNNNLTTLLIIFFLTTSLTLGFLSYKKATPESKKQIATKLSALPIPIPKPTHNPTPTPTPKAKTSSQSSPNGYMILTLKTKEISPNQIKSDLFVKTEKETEPPTEQLIFSETTANTTNFEIPFNTWSPDNKYFFVKKNNKTTANFLVFEAFGKKIGAEPNNTLFLDVNNYFLEKEIPYNINDITGWAAPNLLIVTTAQIGEDTEGPSYWFNILRQNFIGLSTRF